MKQKLLGTAWRILLYGVLLALLQIFFRYQFFFLEQWHMFRFDHVYASETILRIGGFARYAGEFIIQFFKFPWMGAAAIAALLTLCAWCFTVVIKSIARIKGVFIFALLPVLGLLLIMDNLTSMMQAVVAYTMMAFMLAGYVKISTAWMRRVTGIVMIVALFFSAGSVAVLLAFSMVAWEVLVGKNWYNVLLQIVIAALMVFLSIRLAWIGELRFALLPDMYLDPQNSYAAWWLLPAGMLAAWFIGRRVKKEAGRKGIIALIAVQCLVLLGVFFWKAPIYDTDPMRKLAEYHHYVNNQRWGRILSLASSQEVTNHVEVNCINLALSYRGELGDKMFFYTQNGAQGVRLDDNSSAMPAAIVSDVTYKMGNVQSAMKYAFESAMTSMSPSGSPRMYKRLVETNLILGEWAVAEKYIKLLENTLFYRDWAEGMRKYLNNPEMVASDPVFGPKLKGITSADGRRDMALSVDESLEKVAVNNPDDQTAIQYLAALYLANWDINNFKRILELYAGTPVWPTLSRSHEEAIFIIEQNDPQYWYRFEVSSDTKQRFFAFDDSLEKNFQRPDAAQTMKREYGNTYWYYYIFMKPDSRSGVAPVGSVQDARTQLPTN